MPDKLYKLKNRTQYAPTDDKRLKVVIGGNTDYFAPAVNFSYEFESGSEKLFLNICDDPEQVDTSQAIETFSNNKIKVKTGDIESSFELVNGRLKINRSFDVKPTGAPRYRIKQSKGISWHYQPALTLEEIQEGHERPDEVVGSYAIYCDRSHHIKDKTGKTIANYQTGKLAHLYAPYWIDAVGKKIKGVQEYKDGWLTFALPDPEWLDNAIYPVTLDPDVGYTTAGSSTYGSSTYIRGNYAYDFNAGTLNSISIYARTTSSEDADQLGLYDVDGSDEPNNLIDSSSSVGDITSSAAWVSATLSATITAGKYCPCYATAGSVIMYYDTVSGAAFMYDTSLTSLPDPFSGTLSATENAYSLYVTYTETATGPTVPQTLQAREKY